jgi:predicted ATP-grasp superfamily ATP-dependent carboligase
VSVAAPGPPAIILGGGPIAVPVARSLHAAGVEVCALGTASDPVRWSRACRRFVDLGVGDGVQDRWLGWLRERHVAGAVLLPCNDDALDLLARERAAMDGLGYRSAEATAEAVAIALDKERTYALAREHDIPAPRTALAAGADETRAAAERIGFPCALKPRHSHVLAWHFDLREKVLFARDRDELDAQLLRLAGLDVPMIVTEVIPGPDDAHHSYYSYIDDAGRPLLHLTKRKLRQYPPSFGLASYHLIHRDQDVMDAGLELFAAMGVRGIACVEFKRDARDAQLKLIEVNHRLTAGTEIVHHAGVDLALLVYARAAGRPDPPLGAYRTGVRMWHPVEDTRAFVALRRHGELSLGAWLASLLHPQHFPLFSWRDPQPSLRSWSRLLRRLLRARARG